MAKLTYNQKQVLSTRQKLVEEMHRNRSHDDDINIFNTQANELLKCFDLKVLNEKLAAVRKEAREEIERRKAMTEKLIALSKKRKAQAEALEKLLDSQNNPQD